MRNRPNAPELLDIAEKTLTGRIAPDPGPHQRYNLLLVAAAIGTARREIAGGPTAFPGELEALTDLYGALEGNDESVLLRLNSRLATDFRDGAFDDGPDRDAALALLRADVLARLAEDNPAYKM